MKRKSYFICSWVIEREPGYCHVLDLILDDDGMLYFHDAYGFGELADNIIVEPKDWGYCPQDSSPG